MESKNTDWQKQYLHMWKYFILARLLQICKKKHTKCFQKLSYLQNKIEIFANINLFISLPLSDKFQVRRGADPERHAAESGSERLGEEVRGGGNPTFLQAERRLCRRWRGAEDGEHERGELVSDAHRQRNGQRRGHGLLRRTRGGEAGPRDGKLPGVTNISAGL